MSREVFFYEVSVPGSVIDGNGHVNNVEYVRWMQEAAVAHADATGCTVATREAGASWVVRSHHIEYLRPVFAGEKLVVETWVVTLRKSSSLRKYRCVCNGVRVAWGETLWVFVEAGTGRPKAIPEAVSITLPLVVRDDGR